MKHTNKKGFTIVELVIVIAVIAILAAVLIPTFTNLVKKANLSADTQLIKSLNTVLTAEEAINGAPADFSEVIAIIKANGYIVENLNPTTAGHFVVWESTTNQFILVDGEFKVVYSAEKLENKNISGTWFFAVKEEGLIKTIEDAGGSVIPAVDTAWVAGNGQPLKDLLNKGGVVALSENITLATAPKYSETRGDALRIKNANVIYSLAGQTMTVTDEYNTSQNNKGFSLIHADAKANVVVKDGTIVASVKKTDTGLNLFGVVRVYGGAAVTVENMNIVYNGVDNGGSGSGAVFVAQFANGDVGSLVVKDTVVTVSNAMGAEISSGTATFENVTFKNAGDGAWNDLCVAVSFGGTATIKSGTYIAATAGSNKGYSVGVLSGGTLNIEGGTFEGNLYIGTQSDAEGDSVINITGGSFNGIAFADMTDADWNAIVTDDAAVITGVGTGTVTITVKKAN